MKLFGSSFFGRVLRSERGVEGLELAIILPVFVAMIFGFIDVARMVSGFSTVRVAAALGARYAVGQQRGEWTAVQVAMGGNYATQKVIVNGSTLQISPEFVSDSDYSVWYPQQCVNQGITTRELYRLEVRAIGYANKIMSETVGRDAKYPCTEPGCFHCFTLRGDGVNYDKFFSVDAGGGTRRWTAKTLAMTCTYHVPITSALVGLGLLPSQIPVTGRAFVPINDYAGQVYDPGAS